MATLYVENVPDDIYKALREQARRHRKSIAAEVIELLEQTVPTVEDLKKRRKAIGELAKLRALPPAGSGPFPSTEEMIREDRER
jgi:plasmid stability protein